MNLLSTDYSKGDIVWFIKNSTIITKGYLEMIYYKQMYIIGESSSIPIAVLGRNEPRFKTYEEARLYLKPILEEKKQEIITNLNEAYINKHNTKNYDLIVTDISNSLASSINSNLPTRFIVKGIVNKIEPVDFDLKLFSSLCNRKVTKTSSKGLFIFKYIFKVEEVAYDTEFTIGSIDFNTYLYSMFNTKEEAIEFIKLNVEMRITTQEFEIQFKRDELHDIELCLRKLKNSEYD